MCKIFHLALSWVLLTFKGVGVVVKIGPNVSSPAIGSQVGISYAADACLTCGKEFCSLSSFFFFTNRPRNQTTVCKEVRPLAKAPKYLAISPLELSSNIVFAPPGMSYQFQTVSSLQPLRRSCVAGCQSTRH
jgi:Zn-dependent alcohol dehydrogenase